MKEEKCSFCSRSKSTNNNLVANNMNEDPKYLCAICVIELKGILSVTPQGNSVINVASTLQVI